MEIETALVTGPPSPISRRAFLLRASATGAAIATGLVGYSRYVEPFEPEWTRVLATGAAEQEATIGAAFGAMVRVRPNILLGGEARYLRRYEGIGLNEFSG